MDNVVRRMPPEIIETPTPAPAPVIEPAPYREPMPTAIVEAIAKVMSDARYVQKKGTNKDHNYKYTAIGDLLAALQPAMADAGLVVVQDEGPREFLTTEGAHLVIKYSFTLHVGGESWPRHKPIIKSGVSMFKFRSGGIDDKAINKCATSARKYFLLELFQVPSGEGLADPDDDGDELRGDHRGNTGNGGGGPVPSNEPDGIPEDPRFSRGQPPEAAKSERRQNAENWHRNALAELDDCKTSDDLFRWETTNSDTVTKLSRNHADLHKTLVAKLQARNEAIA